MYLIWACIGAWMNEILLWFNRFFVLLVRKWYCKCIPQILETPLSSFRSILFMHGSLSILKLHEYNSNVSICLLFANNSEFHCTLYREKKNKIQWQKWIDHHIFKNKILMESKLHAYLLKCFHTKLDSMASKYRNMLKYH